MDKRDYLSFKQLAAFVPPNGVHWMTVYRWARRGIKVSDRTVKLRTIRVSNRLYSSRLWLNEFLAVQQQDAQTSRDLMAGGRMEVAQDLDRELAT